MTPLDPWTLELEVLPVAHGDCLLLSWRDGGPTRRLVVDGGPRASAGVLRRRIEQLPEDQRALELLVVTHIDTDHIDGALELQRNPPPAFGLADVWFNGYRQLPESGERNRGPREGAMLDAVLERRERPTNQLLGGASVVRPHEGLGPPVELPGGMRLTVLSPTLTELAQLRPHWTEVVERAQRAEPDDDEDAGTRRAETGVHRGGLSLEAFAATPSRPDRALANASSIALLAEFGERRLILAADAVPHVLAPALENVRRPGESRAAVDVFKLPHHGSARNVTRAVTSLVEADRLVISTNGARFGHPDMAAVARAILDGAPRPELMFNYESVTTTGWNDPVWCEEKRFKTTFAPPGEPLRIVLAAAATR
jgi:beta-lactamase superfamily II metal-dependent hydrolase